MVKDDEDENDSEGVWKLLDLGDTVDLRVSNSKDFSSFTGSSSSSFTRSSFIGTTSFLISGANVKVGFDLFSGETSDTCSSSLSPSHI